MKAIRESQQHRRALEGSGASQVRKRRENGVRVETRGGGGIGGGYGVGGVKYRKVPGPRGQGR